MTGATPSPQRPAHPDAQLDAFIGNMIANRGCEIDNHDEYLTLSCACSSGHRVTVLKHPQVGANYAQRKIEQIDEAFSCSRRR